VGANALHGGHEGCFGGDVDYILGRGGGAGGGDWWVVDRAFLDA